jgi:hypothetical protein
VRFCSRHRQPSMAMATSDSRTRSTSTEQAWNSFRARVAERSPGHRGGETVLPGAPPLTRLATCPGAVCGRAYLTACPDRRAFQRGIPIFSAESTLFWALPRQGSNPTAFRASVRIFGWRCAGADVAARRQLPRCVGGRREGCSRRPAKWNSGVR